jgi:hypothetical protein
MLSSLQRDLGGKTLTECCERAGLREPLTHRSQGARLQRFVNFVSASPRQTTARCSAVS